MSKYIEMKPREWCLNSRWNVALPSKSATSFLLSSPPIGLRSHIPIFQLVSTRKYAQFIEMSKPFLGLEPVWPDVYTGALIF